MGIFGLSELHSVLSLLSLRFIEDVDAKRSPNVSAKFLHHPRSANIDQF